MRPGYTPHSLRIGHKHRLSNTAAGMGNYPPPGAEFWNDSMPHLLRPLCPS